MSELDLRLRHWIGQLSQGLLERDRAVRLALLAALAGEHVLLIGPPGTAKSALARRLHTAFAAPGAAPYFERLLTRFSTPEELFGPLSLKALEEDRYERQTQGFLPQAGVAFIDEVFKANSAILNALLTLLNEREFDNGTQRLRTPLVAVVAASNEVPGDEALLAFYDRFLLRVPVAPVSDAAFEALLALPSPDEAGAASLGQATVDLAPISGAERQGLVKAAALVALSESFLKACQALRQHLAQSGKPLSDRRWRQWVQLMRCAAASEGRSFLDELDLWLTPEVAAHHPHEAPALALWFEQSVLQLPAPAPQALAWPEKACQAFEKQLEIERSQPAAQGQVDSAGKMALVRAIGLKQDLEHGQTGTPGHGPARIVSERLEQRSAKHWGQAHVAARLAQIGEFNAKLEQDAQALAHSQSHLAARLAPRLWWPPALAQGALARYEQNCQALAGLQARLAGVRAGFAALPVDPGLAAMAAPTPIAIEAAARSEGALGHA